MLGIENEWNESSASLAQLSNWTFSDDDNKKARFTQTKKKKYFKLRWKFNNNYLCIFMANKQICNKSAWRGKIMNSEHKNFCFFAFFKNFIFMLPSVQRHKCLLKFLNEFVWRTMFPDCFLLCTLKIPKMYGDICSDIVLRYKLYSNLAKCSVLRLWQENHSHPHFAIIRTIIWISYHFLNIIIKNEADQSKTQRKTILLWKWQHVKKFIIRQALPFSTGN